MRSYYDAESTIICPVSQSSIKHNSNYTYFLPVIATARNEAGSNPVVQPSQ